MSRFMQIEDLEISPCASACHKQRFPRLGGASRLRPIVWQGLETQLLACGTSTMEGRAP